MQQFTKMISLLWKFSVNDFKAKYYNSFLGILWAFIQPLVTIIVMCFVFEVGFKNPPVENMAFVLWFVPAYVPWIFLNDVLSNATNCFYEYSYLVKKIKFQIGILPVMKIISAFFVHIFFILFILILFFLYKEPLTFYLIQAIYYTLALVVLLLGTVFLLSSLTVFFKDLAQVVSMFLQIGFWVTPIFWNPEELTGILKVIVGLNPAFYIVTGYRDSFIYRIGFWEKPEMTCYFWALTLVMLFIGFSTYKRLRPHFADEL